MTATAPGPGLAAMEAHESAATRARAVLIERGIPWGLGQEVGKSVYGTPLLADFMVLGNPDPEGHPQARCGVFVRWQRTSGSADQKLFYLVHSIAQATIPSVLVIDGEGWSEGALAWVRRQHGDRLLAVVDLDGFDRWCSTVVEE